MLVILSVTIVYIIELEIITFYQVLHRSIIQMAGLRAIEGRRINSTVYYQPHCPEHFYCLAKKRGTVGYLKCFQSTCGARGKINAFNPNGNTAEEFILTQTHNHFGSPNKLQELILASRCKKRSADETTPLRTIYNEERERSVLFCLNTDISMNVLHEILIGTFTIHFSLTNKNEHNF